MKLVWGRGLLRLLSVLGLLAATPFGALAEMAEIGGIASVYVRVGPGTDFETIETLAAGDPVDILDVEGSWTKIQTREGKVGFVYHKYVLPHVRDAATPIAPAIPAAAVAPIAPVPRPQSTRAVPPASAVVTAPAPAPMAEPAAPSSSGAPRDDLTTELGHLRSEIADLKREIQDRAADMDEAHAQNARGIVSPIPTNDSSSVMSSREQSAGALAVGFLALLVGWVLGSAFTRRRSRSQRPRLRF